MVNFLTVRTQSTIYYVRRFFSDLTGDIHPCAHYGYATVLHILFCLLAGSQVSDWSVV